MFFIFKRVFDFLFSLILIFLLSPLLLMISVAVKLDSKGSVFFKQNRLGKNGKVFKIIKFRSMVVGAEKKGTGLDSFSDDPRVTKVGKFIRDTSLDELPQLFNIIMGEMSFVGPRPPVTYSPYNYKDYSEVNKVRFSVKPGVTGLAQINGRNELSWDEKFVYDIKYVNNVSLLLDFKILVMTLIKVLKNEGAYDKKK